MICFLEGTLEEKQPTRVVLNVGGVGYEVFIPLSTYDRLPKQGETCRVLTYDHIREDARTLFGFIREADRGVFELLLSITGIGPKIALSALSGLSARELKAAVVEGDTKRLSSVSGIGKKMAERMVVELRHKLSDADALEAVAGASDEPEDHRLRDAILALIALGYKQVDAQKHARDAILRCSSDDSVEAIVKKALVKG
jgi:Holliday junction DNA helicase RuvA